MPLVNIFKRNKKDVKRNERSAEQDGVSECERDNVQTSTVDSESKSLAELIKESSSKFTIDESSTIKESLSDVSGDYNHKKFENEVSSLPKKEMDSETVRDSSTAANNQLFDGGSANENDVENSGESSPIKLTHKYSDEVNNPEVKVKICQDIDSTFKYGTLEINDDETCRSLKKGICLENNSFDIVDFSDRIDDAILNSIESGANVLHELQKNGQITNSKEKQQFENNYPKQDNLEIGSIDILDKNKITGIDFKVEDETASIDVIDEDETININILNEDVDKYEVLPFEDIDTYDSYPSKDTDSYDSVTKEPITKESLHTGCFAKEHPAIAFSIIDAEPYKKPNLNYASVSGNDASIDKELELSAGSTCGEESKTESMDVMVPKESLSDRNSRNNVSKTTSLEECTSTPDTENSLTDSSSLADVKQTNKLMVGEDLFDDYLKASFKTDTDINIVSLNRKKAEEQVLQTTEQSETGPDIDDTNVILKQKGLNGSSKSYGEGDLARIQKENDVCENLDQSPESLTAEVSKSLDTRKEREEHLDENTEPRNQNLNSISEEENYNIASLRTDVSSSVQSSNREFFHGSDSTELLSPLPMEDKSCPISEATSNSRDDSLLTEHSFEFAEVPSGHQTSYQKVEDQYRSKEPDICLQECSELFMDESNCYLLTDDEVTNLQSSSQKSDVRNWKVGYMEVKRPTKSRKSKLKAWQKRWVVIQSDEFTSDSKTPSLMLSIYHSESGNSRRHSAMFWRSVSSKSALVYRSSSKTHPFAFTINNGTEPVLHLAAESETRSQEWMAAIRSILWPPNTVVQLEKVLNGNEFDVSVIDNDFAYRAGLLGTYGYLSVNNRKLILCHPQSGHVIQEWYLNTVDKFQMLQQSNEADANKVLLMYTSSDSSTGCGEIRLFCEEAVGFLKCLAATIHKVLQFHSKANDQCYERELDQLSGWLTPQPSPTVARSANHEGYYKTPQRQVRSLLDIPNFIFDMPTPTVAVSEALSSDIKSSSTLKASKTNVSNFSQDSGVSVTMPADEFLNCSGTSFMIGNRTIRSQDRTSSESSETYTPPRSPVLEKKEKLDNEAIS